MAAQNTSVDQIFDALDVLSRATEPVGLSELARVLHLPLSTAHRLLATLQDTGYAERDSSGTKSELGRRAHQLVHGLFRQFGVRQAGIPLTSRLAREIGETVALDVRVGWYGVRMAGAEGWREVHAATRIGEMAALGLSTAGTAILAFLPDDELARYRAWHHHNSRDATSPNLDEVASSGFASRSLGDDGVELAVPIRVEGRAIAAVSIEGVGPLLPSPSHDPEVLAPVLQAVQEFEQLLAAQPHLRRDPFSHVDPDTIRLAIKAE